MTNMGFRQRAQETLSLMEGATIYAEGEPGDRMYIVVAGEVDIRCCGRRLAVARAGELIGEMALIDREVRCATAIARTDCLLAPVDSQRFLSMVQEAPTFALQVMQVLVKHLRLANKPWDSDSGVA
jgi:CRP/FNR family transcriptional regulator, cyclic AMP receptor protein